MASGELYERWEFLEPWCAALASHISYRWPEIKKKVWEMRRPRLEVSLPTRADSWEVERNTRVPIYDDEADFRRQFKLVREALALLAAVAQVDQAAWKYLLRTFCGVGLTQQVLDNELPAHFLVYSLEETDPKKFSDSAESDLIQLCSVLQRSNTTRAYGKALKRIASLDSRLVKDKPGVEVKVPIRVWFGVMNDQEATRESLKPLEAIQRAEAAIREQRKKFDWTYVKPGRMHCNFVLEPMIVDFGDNTITPVMTKMMKELVEKNVWFSELSIWVKMNRIHFTKAQSPTNALAQLMAQLFQSDRGSYALANTRYHGEYDALQMGTVHLEFVPFLSARSVASVCSALAVNQTTRKLSLRLDMNLVTNAGTNRLWWEWLAYGLFSRRARSCSALESLAFISTGGLTEADVGAFVSILDSEHPEEELYGRPSGEVSERNATLKAGALIYVEVTNRGLPGRGSGTSFPTALRSLRTFSDDEKSELVNVLVPGYGHCLVQRADLVFENINREAETSRGVTTLSIGFDKDRRSISSGLPRFIEAVGGPLKYLTLDGPRPALDVTWILEKCPSLEELALYGYFVDVRINLCEFRANNRKLPSPSCNWDAISEVVAALSDPNHDVALCVTRLRVRLMNRRRGWDDVARIYDETTRDTHLTALLQMLGANRSLLFLDVVVPLLDFSRNIEFKKHHQQTTRQWHKLERETKLAFLSILPYQRASRKKLKKELSQAKHLLPEVNQNVLSKIFGLASTPVLRKVYYREPRVDAWEEERVQVQI